MINPNTLSLSAAIALLSLSGVVHATACPENGPCGPPAGNVILDLAGTPLPTGYAEYTASFVATQTSTSVSFAFRNDVGTWFLDDVVVASATSGNLIQNGGFELPATIGAQPTSWAVLNPLGLPPENGAERATTSPGGTVSCAHSGSWCYADLTGGGYDILTQALLTSVGTQYTVDFWLATDGTASPAGQTGDNATDALVYAGEVPVYNVPEPGLLGLFGFGIAGLGLMRRQRRG